jgi:hypothetical protein
LRRLKTIAKNAKVRDATLHKFRHTYLRPSEVVSRDYGRTRAWARGIYEQRQWIGVRWWSYYDPRWASVGLCDIGRMEVEDVRSLRLDNPALVEASQPHDRPANHRKFSSLEVGTVVEAILDSIVEAVRNGERVELRGFGTFAARRLQGIKKPIPTIELFLTYGRWGQYSYRFIPAFSGRPHPLLSVAR